MADTTETSEYKERRAKVKVKAYISQSKLRTEAKAAGEAAREVILQRDYHDVKAGQAAAAEATLRYHCRKESQWFGTQGFVTDPETMPLKPYLKRLNELEFLTMSSQPAHCDFDGTLPRGPITHRFQRPYVSGVITRKTWELLMHNVYPEHFGGEQKNLAAILNIPQCTRHFSPLSADADKDAQTFEEACTAMAAVVEFQNIPLKDDDWTGQMDRRIYDEIYGFSQEEHDQIREVMLQDKTRLEPGYTAEAFWNAAITAFTP